MFIFLKFECDTGGTILIILFECSTIVTFNRGQPAFFNFFIITQNHIQAIQNKIYKIEFEKTKL